MKLSYIISIENVVFIMYCLSHEPSLMALALTSLL